MARAALLPAIAPAAIALMAFVVKAPVLASVNHVRLIIPAWQMVFALTCSTVKTPIILARLVVAIAVLMVSVMAPGLVESLLMAPCATMAFAAGARLCLRLLAIIARVTRAARLIAAIIPVILKRVSPIAVIVVLAMINVKPVRNATMEFALPRSSKARVVALVLSVQTAAALMVFVVIALVLRRVILVLRLIPILRTALAP